MKEYQEENLARAISASSRRQILRFLSEGELTVKDIAGKTGMSMSLASRHLQFLYDLGFLQTRKAPPYKFYSLKITEIKELLEIYDKVLKKSIKS
ncbi:MAG: metalloregulator ArsR/SmtB family transcription factor [Nanoarchaeota archaeon]